MRPRHLLVAALAALAASALVGALASAGKTSQRENSSQFSKVHPRDYTLSRHHRTRRQIGRNLSVLGLLFQLIGETRRDIQKTFNDISRQVENSIADENAIVNATAASGRESAASERPRITRQELMRILSLNWRGLTRLFNREVDIALDQSNKSAAEARSAFWTALAPFLEPATTTARSTTTSTTTTTTSSSTTTSTTTARSA